MKFLVHSKLSGKCSELFRLYTNKVREVVVARVRQCAQTDRSVLKRKHLLLLFSTSCVLGLCQDLAPTQRWSKGGWHGAGYKTVGQYNQELGRSAF